MSGNSFENNIRLSSIYHSTLIGIIIINKEGILKAMNPTALKLLGYTELELLGKPLFNFVDSSDTSELKKYLDNAHDQHDATDIKLVDHQGNICAIKFELTHSISESSSYFVGIFSDISKRKKLEKEVKKQKELKNKVIDRLEQEKELSELKTRFLSIASHEFKTPLAGILSSLQLIKRYLEKDKPNWEKLIHYPKIETHFDKIEESITLLNTILDDFLSLGKLEENKVQVHYNKINIPSFMNETIKEIKVLCKKGQEIKYVQSSEDQTIHLDKHILKNIMNNLITNSIKYSPANTLIEVKSEFKAEFMQIAVKDQGIGIPTSEQKNLFKRFFRANNAASISGTGLGLSIVWRFVNIMGGHISYESEENQGTTFYVKFPLNQPH